MTDNTPKSDYLKEIPACEILAKIEKGEPVEYDQIIIDGALNLSELELPRNDLELFCIMSKIKITNSIITSAIDFNNAIILHELDFSGNSFKGDACFHKTQFSKANFIGSEFCGNADFGWAYFRETATFGAARFKAITWFIGTQFRGHAYFVGARFEGETRFTKIVLRGQALFREIEFLNMADFEGANFSGVVSFEKAKFNGPAYFKEANFSGRAYFCKVTFLAVGDFRKSRFNMPISFIEAHFAKEADFRFADFEKKVDFEKASFMTDVYFSDAQFKSDSLSFREAKFSHPTDQEYISRIAKQLLEHHGDRDEAGYYFYREMESKRKQKPWFTRYPEYIFIQLIFGYGVHPWRLMAWWSITVITFAVFYWIGSQLDGATQLFDYVKFSLATAIAPGYIATIISIGSTGYKLAPAYQAVAIMESIFGTFLWAAFIATFAKKYMR